MAIVILLKLTTYLPRMSWWIMVENVAVDVEKCIDENNDEKDETEDGEEFELLRLCFNINSSIFNHNPPRHPWQISRQF